MSMPRWIRARGFAFALASILLLGGVLAAGLAWAADEGGGRHAHADQVARGEYLARAGDCVACHTGVGGRPMAGGKALPTPFGTLYAPNITPDRETGIGSWSAGDFRRAMHEGINVHGDYLYPAFPYTSFTRVMQEDLDAIWAWLRTVKPVHRPDVPNELSFPYSWRTLLGLWRMLYFDKGEFEPDPGKSQTYNRGAYLVEGLGHCGDCHTSRNWLGATRGSRHLEGAMVPGQSWYAPDLGTAEGNGLEKWSKRDIVDFLKHGRSARGIAYGPMAEVVHSSTQYLTTRDLEAMATYLLERPSKPSPRAGKGFEPPATSMARKRRLQDHMARGRKIYAGQCADCHGKHGEGEPNIYPALAGNSSILSDSPVNAIRKVLLGGFAPATKAWPRPYSMPPFIQSLSDREVADVVTWVRHAWGNRPATEKPYSAVREETVAEYRSAFQRYQ